MSAVGRALLCLIAAALLMNATPPVSGSAQVYSSSPVPSGSVRHVVTIVMENEEYSSVIGNPSAPYENALAANYTLLTSYYGVTHPSLPNYLAMVSGNTYVSSDCAPSQCSVNSSSVVNLLQSRGLSWREYAESMPANCSQTASADGLYQPKHNPFVYFENITGNNGSGPTSAYCDSHVVSLSQFWVDLAANALPAYSFVTPNMCDDGHDCSLSTADAWLSTVVPKIEASQEFASTVVFVVYDEGSTNAGFGDVAGGQVPCIVVSPLVIHGYRSDVQYSHYSLLATTESLLGLGGLGRNDSTAQPMSDIFSSCANCQTTLNSSASSASSSSSSSSTALSKSSSSTAATTSAPGPSAGSASQGSDLATVAIAGGAALVIVVSSLWAWRRPRAGSRKSAFS